MRNPVISLAVMAAFFVAAPAAPAGERFPLQKDLNPLRKDLPPPPELGEFDSPHAAHESNPLYKDLPPPPESLPDEAFDWSGNVTPIPNRAGFHGGLRSPYRDTYGHYNVHLGCSQRPRDRWFVTFEFPRRRTLRALRRALRETRRKPGEPFEDWLRRRDLIQPLRVGLWSRVHEAERPAGGGEGYLLRHDVELYEGATRYFAFSDVQWNKVQIEGAAARDLIRKIQRADSINWTEVETATTSPAMPVSEEMRASIGRVMEACGISHGPPPATPTAAPDRPAFRP